jgi:hypothetical protein
MLCFKKYIFEIFYRAKNKNVAPHAFAVASFDKQESRLYNFLEGLEWEVIKRVFEHIKRFA